MKLDGETYIGDGLYASFDGYQIQLRAPQSHGDQFVYLEPSVYVSLLEYAKTIGWVIKNDRVD